jgi:hypothetical protein
MAITNSFEKMVLPPMMYAVVGREINIFFGAIVPDFSPFSESFEVDA